MPKENSWMENCGGTVIPKPKSLLSLLSGLAFSVTSMVKPDQVIISSVTADSREACHQTLFIALTGEKTDGHLYINNALRQGCAAVVVREGWFDETLDLADVCIVAVEDPRCACAAIAANYYEHPARGLRFVGITGTNGKTTITYLLETVFRQHGLSVGVVGTVNYRCSTPAGITVLPAPYTTPEPLLLQKLLHYMVGVGVEYVLMEVSSHALLQDRLGDIRFDVAAFTNLSRDHLDYHSGMEDYFAAKSRLFTDYLKPGGIAVITCGDAGPDQTWQFRLAKICRERGIATLQVGMSEKADVRLIVADSRRDGTTIMLETVGGGVRINSPLVGRFNVENIITTIGICQAMDMVPSAVAACLAIASGAPGRLQRVKVADDPSRPVVFVDYAHSPDALRKVLSTLAALPRRNLFCVFGCGGDRDAGKRPLMGEIAAIASDVVIVTDDNPRSESSAKIIDQILPGIEGAGSKRRDVSWLRNREGTEKGFLVLPVREEAIAAAVKSAGAEDIVLVAGKGHETYQIGPEGRRFFDDTLEVEESLISWNCTSISKAIGGTFAGTLTGPAFNMVSTDSRSIAVDDIFVALRGETFDGHEFVPQAIASGAACLIVSDPEVFARHTEVPRFLVADTLSALGSLAAYRRRLVGATRSLVVIGLTGSCGKTTVKEMTAAILERHWPEGPETPPVQVLKTHGNFNNLIGLPLSLLPLGLRHHAAILEMGMNRPGEIASLAHIADPDISCIVSVYPAHLEGLHSIDGVAAAKEELFAGTRSGGTLVINLDDAYVRAMAPRYQQRKITFSAHPEGAESKPDLWASNITVTSEGGSTYVLHMGNQETQVRLNVPGSHNVSNSLAAAATAHAAGCQLSTIAAGLSDFRPKDKRMVVAESALGLMLIDDTYNANPGSMAAGLATLSQLARGRSMAILGDMLELGAASSSCHNTLGGLAARHGLSYLALFGEFACDVRAGAVAAGMDPLQVRVFMSKDEIVAWVLELSRRGALKRGDWVLIKASRGMRFETIVGQLKDCT